MSLVLLAHVELVEGETVRAQNLLVEGAAISRAIGNLAYAPWCPQGPAGAAAALGEWDRAARLCGACEAPSRQAGRGLAAVLRGRPCPRRREYAGGPASATVRDGEGRGDERLTGAVIAVEWVANTNKR